MKQIQIHFFLCAFLTFLFSCSETSNKAISLLPKANQTTNSIMVVVNDGVWTKTIREGIEFIFQQPIKGLYAEEPEFDVIQISDISASDLLKNQRYIVELTIDKNLLSSKVLHKENRWANGQLFFQISAPDEQALLFSILNDGVALKQLITEHQNKQFLVQIGEDKRFIFKGDTSFKVPLPSSFVNVNQENNFAYFGLQGKALCESGNAFQCPYQLGYFIYKEAYKDAKQFSQDYIDALRDSLTKKYILGPLKDVPTYMETESNFPVVTDTVAVDDIFAVRQSGWWNMVNATMGGPFRTFVFVSEKSQTFYLTSFFVFAPNFSKRDFLYELEQYNTAFMLELLKVK